MIVLSVTSLKSDVMTTPVSTYFDTSIRNRPVSLCAGYLSVPVSAPPCLPPPVACSTAVSMASISHVLHSCLRHYIGFDSGKNGAKRVQRSYSLPRCSSFSQASAC